MLLRQGQGAAAVRGGQLVLHTAVWARDALRPPLPAEVSRGRLRGLQAHR